MGADTCSFTIHRREIRFVSFIYPEAGSFILGAIRIVIFSVFAAINYRNHRLVAQKEGSFNMAYVRGLILPSYHEFFYLLILVNVIAAVFDISTGYATDSKAESINNIVLPLEMGAFHCLTEGFAVFLSRHGAGVLAFRNSLRWGLLWGVITFVVFFMEVRIRNSNNSNSPKLAFLIFFIYTGLLLIFYGLLAFASDKLIYRRSALLFYSRFFFGYQLFLIIAAILVASNQQWSICPDSFLGLVIIAILQPVIIFRTLQLDSQFWQGRSVNPLSDIWDEIDISTAASMATGLYELESASRHLPILHFGMLSLDSSLGYVAGGYSRVYFGKLKGTKVALKIMYVMELTPNDVQDYYREANILYSLQHKNVVGCFGICVMPPALTLVLEFCLFGSLFDFLHKNREGFDNENSDVESISLPSASVSRQPSIAFRRTSSARHAEPTPSDIRERTIKLICRAQLGSPADLGLMRNTEVGDMDVRRNMIITSVQHTRYQPGSGHVYASSSTTSSSIQNPIKPINTSERASSALTAPLLSTGSLGGSSAGGSSNSSAQSTGDIKAALESGAYKMEVERASEDSVATLNSAKERGSIASSSSKGHQNVTQATTTRNSFTSTQDFGVVYSSIRPSLSTSSRMGFNLTKDGASINATPRVSTDRDRAPSIIDRMRNSLMSIAGFGATSDTGSSTHQPQKKQLPPFGHLVGPDLRLKMACDAVRAVVHLHEKGYMHCDIKSLNFLVCEDLTVKLADFGETVKVGSPPRHTGAIIQARQWAPPEVLAPGATSSDYSIESDIYSLAIVLSEIVTLHLFGENADKILPQLWYNQLVVEHVRPQLPLDCNPELVDCLQRSWDSNKNKRLTAEEILQTLESIESLSTIE